MHEDLEPIANLKYGQVVEHASKEGQTKLSAQMADLAARGLSNSGMMVSARMNSALDTSERTCRAIYEIWLDLILQRNQGKISREDINFIMDKVNACVQARALQIAQAIATPGAPDVQWAVDQARGKMQSVGSVIGRELEIKFREQEAFRKEEIARDTSF